MHEAAPIIWNQIHRCLECRIYMPIYSDILIQTSTGIKICAISVLSDTCRVSEQCIPLAYMKKKDCIITLFGVSILSHHIGRNVCRTRAQHLWTNMLEPKWLDSNMQLKLFCRYSYLHTGPKSVHLLEVSQSTRKKGLDKSISKKSQSCHTN